MWFAHATGPLGTYVRTKWAYIVDLEECAQVADARGGPYVTLSGSRLEDLMLVSSMDPDLVDVLRLSEKGRACLFLYGR